MRLAAGGGDRLVAAPVEGRREAAIGFRPGHDRRREGEQRHAEANRIGVALGHARGGRGDANRVDRTLETRPMRRPHRLGARIAVVVGEAVGERGGRPVVCSRVAVEARQDVARRRAAHPRERRERNPAGEREQDDAGDAQRPRRELPRPKPGGGQEENHDRERKHERRPRALDRERALRQSRQCAKARPVLGADGLVRILHRDAVIRRCRIDYRF